jgi:hypothetical protein
MLLEHSIRLAASRAACTAGSKRAIKSPIIATTTNNSTSVNALNFGNVLIIISFLKKIGYTVAGKAIGFALEQTLHVVAIASSASRILKRLQHIWFNLLKFFVQKFATVHKM